MDKIISCVIISCLALANAGLVPLQSAVNILEGPSTRTKVIGPDGSVIDAYAPGGKIVLDDHAVGVGPLVQPAPIVLAQAAIIAEPPPAPAAPLEFHHPVEAVDDAVSVEASNIARVSEDGQRVFLHPGTAPRVETRESVPVTEASEETTVGTTELPQTSEFSGEYIANGLERLYDDGSYRAEHY